MTNIVNQLYGLPYRGWLALATLLLFLLFTLVLFKRVTATYQTPGEKPFQLQLAWNADNFKKTLESWSANNPRAPEIYKWDNLVKLDLLFPLTYSTLFAFAYAWSRATPGPVTTWDYVFFLTPFCAALFDYYENSFHLYLLRDINTREQAARASFPDGLVYISTVCSYVKLTLFGVGSVAFVGPLIKRLFR